MNENTFLFVTCVNNKTLYEASVKDIATLSVPAGYKVELFPIYDAKSMTEGYNRAIPNKAKYKLYIHQDTFFLNKNILHELLFHFKSNPKLGLLGVIGCKSLTSSGVWWEGKDLIGKIICYHGKYRNISFSDTNLPFEAVESIDGVFMATQYDIPWREEIEGFHFYDASQSFEFIKNGYIVGIPRQTEPWILHVDKEKTDIYDRTAHQRGQQIFLKHYSDLVREKI